MAAVVCGSKPSIRLLPARRHAVRMQAASFDNSSSLIPRQETSAASFCSWPRKCDWPGAPQTQAPLSQRIQAALFHADDPTLPPGQVESCALFSDGFEDSSNPALGGNWLTRMWRYQGLGL